MAISVSTPLAGAHSAAVTTTEAAFQLVKTVVLTNPNERILDGNFGVGLKKVLFEQDSPVLRADLRSRISSQIATYVPQVQLLGVQLSPPDGTDSSLSVGITYVIRIGSSASDLQEINFTYDEGGALSSVAGSAIAGTIDSSSTSDTTADIALR